MESNAKQHRSQAAQLLDHYHARRETHARILFVTHYYHKGFRITSQRSHIVAHLLNLRKSGCYGYRRRDVWMQSVGPQVLSVLAGKDVFVLRTIR